MVGRVMSKNSQINRGVGQRTRMLDDKVVKATLYFGKHAGHGKYMAGTVDGELVCDENGKPIPLRMIGKLV